MRKITIEKLKDLFFELQDRFLSVYWKRKSLSSRLNGHVLMYHHVTNEEVDIIPSCIRTPKQFISGLESERNNGYTFISVSEFINIDPKNYKQKFCLVTFDDVPANFITCAYPYLKENKIPFTLFITTEYLTDKKYLSEEQIKELDKDFLCTIGAHTISHPMLRRCCNPEKELLESKRILESILGHSVDIMAYPFGKHSSISKHIRKLTKKVGYVCAFSTINAPISEVSYKSKFFIPRIVI